jgi:hypothetical protein
MKKALLTPFFAALFLVGCKKEDTKPVTVEVYGSVKKYELGYFVDGELYQRTKLVDSAYIQVYEYSTTFKYGFNASIKDTFGWVVLKVTDGNKLYYDSIVGTPGVSARVNP